ncbi:MAG: PAS domain-containing protein, partial [Desulfobulbaceae bacterium]|nr:PAS domain-containing protein [Desulfobulbaceae bacterium]
MNFLNLGSIRNKLAFLVILAVLPALIILLYSGVEQRQHSIESAKQDVLLLTRTMGEAQKEITRSTRKILSTLSILPAIQNIDLQASSNIFRAMLKQNPSYTNITLTGLDGEVLASGRTFTRINLADRKHFREAIERKDFAVGEYIMSRVGLAVPAFAFAFPVLDEKNSPKAVLTAAIKLSSLAHFHSVSTLPEKSFVAMTDNQGIRLFYYPPKEETNPVGKPIRGKNWARASKAKQSGLFIGRGSDGTRRIIAFEQVRLSPVDTPYLYVWAGIPEAHILEPANTALIRNLLLMLLATIVSLLISWVVSKNTLITPIQSLVALARKFARGDLESSRELAVNSGELGTLTNAFYDMASALIMSQKKLRENEEHFRTVADFAYDWEYWVNPDGKFEYISPSCQRITGYSPEEFLKDGSLLITICLPEDRHFIHGHINKESLNDEAATTLDFRILTKNGETRWINHICQPIISDDGKFLGRRACNRDISDQKRAEKEKEKLEDRLQQAQKMEAIGTLA